MSKKIFEKSEKRSKQISQKDFFKLFQTSVEKCLKNIFKTFICLKNVQKIAEKKGKLISKKGKMSDKCTEKKEMSEKCLEKVPKMFERCPKKKVRKCLINV